MFTAYNKVDAGTVRYSNTPSRCCISNTSEKDCNK